MVKQKRCITILNYFKKLYTTISILNQLLICKDSTIVKLGSTTEGAKIYYTLDGKEPSLKSAVYEKPICIKENKTLSF